MSSERDFDEAHRAGEREAEDMERREERLGEEIDRIRGEWEAKKTDASVPGALPEDDPEERDEDGPPPEADVVTPGD
jgi:hypothetical protein